MCTATADRLALDYSNPGRGIIYQNLKRSLFNADSPIKWDLPKFVFFIKKKNWSRFKVDIDLQVPKTSTNK